MMGVVAGGQSYQPGLSDFVFMTKDSATFIAGPPLVEAVIGEKISSEDLGGAEMHASVSGVCHVVAEDEVECINKVRELLAYLPSNNRQKPPRVDTGDDPNRTCERLYEVVPPKPKKPYDMHEIIREIVDNGTFFEIHRDYAKSMIVGLARFNGYTTGIVANNPMHLAGGIDVYAAEKAARFIRFCDSFNIPLVYLVSTPAYIVGSVQERAGMIFRGATLLHATSEATVPKVTVILGWAYAGAYIAMGSRYLSADVVFAWPTAEIGLVAAEGVVNVIYRKEIAAAANPEEERKKREEEFKETFMKVYYPASYQHIDDVIDPKDTRIAIIRAMENLKFKSQKLPWKKHGNMPL
jgi:acetyl-CoA carboxylase carboxyltransferase component